MDEFDKEMEELEVEEGDRIVKRTMTYVTKTNEASRKIEEHLDGIIDILKADKAEKEFWEQEMARPWLERKWRALKRRFS